MSILCAENVNINMSTSKRQARVESKKRKLEALLRISNNVDLTPYSRVDEVSFLSSSEAVKMMPVGSGWVIL